jgi:putative endonuclease
MKFFTYILYSDKLDVFYKGHTNSIKVRLKRHNSGNEEYSKKGAPWILLWVSTKDSKSEAYRLELKLKNLSKQKLIELMLKYHEEVVGPDELLKIKQLSGC